MPTRNQARLDSRFLLQHDLFETLPVVESGGQEDIFENVQQLARLLYRRFAAQYQFCYRFFRSERRSGDFGVRDPAGAFANTLREFDEIFPGRPGLEQGAGEHSGQREQLLWQCVQVKAQVQINDPIGEQVMVENLGVLDLKLFDGDGLVLLFQVFEPEDRQFFECFGRIRGFLAEF